MGPKVKMAELMQTEVDPLSYGVGVTRLWLSAAQSLSKALVEP